MKLDTQQVWEIARYAQPYSMVPLDGIKFTIVQTVWVVEKGLPGHIVECGVWKGGCALAMLIAQREAFGKVVKCVHLLDSFQGLPPAQAIDGEAALAWQRNKKSTAYYDNCKASKMELETLLRTNGFNPGDYRIWPGWFEQTCPLLADATAPVGISLLRLDGDWYESTKTCLNWLGALVNPRGAVIVDDYYAWEGCRRAVHEYLGEHSYHYPIKSIKDECGAYFFIDHGG